MKCSDVMAKTYVDIVKYMVEAKFDISGSVEKPDIIGAVFGQTEGLLGSDLDLRELQKNGKIGRIEIDSSTSGNKTYGKLFLPSSLGRVETCILAAAIESVDRVGPFETEFRILKVEDTRNEKRKKIITRAKDLVKTLLVTELPDSREISDLVEADVKSSTVGIYGPEELPAGPDIEKDDEVLLVEGRADVINLLRNDITNCIAVGGASGSIPKTIISLCAAKEATLFVDGDRGGDMIIRSITNVADIDYVAKAPDGKEVEELTRKEIIKALRSRVPIEQILANNKKQIDRQDQRQYQRYGRQPEYREPQQEAKRQQPQEQKKEILSPSEIASNLQREKMREPRQYGKEEAFGGAPAELGIKDINGNDEPEGIDSIPVIEQMKTKPAQPAGNVQGPQAAEAPNRTFLESLTELKNTLRGRLYDENGGAMTVDGKSEIPVRELIQTIQGTQNIHSIVFDGIITQRLVDLAYRQGVKEIYGMRANQIIRKYPELLLYTAEHGFV